MTPEEILAIIENNIVQLKAGIKRVEEEHFEKVADYLKDVEARVLSPAQKKHIKELSDETAQKVAELKESLAENEEDRKIILEEIKKLK